MDNSQNSTPADNTAQPANATANDSQESKVETQKPLTQEEISQKNIDQTKKFLELYNKKFPEMIKLLNDALRYGKEKLTKDNEKNELLKKQIDVIEINANEASIKINDDATNKTDVEFKLEILERTEDELSKEEKDRLTKIDEELAKEEDETKKANLNKEKHSLTHKVLASYVSDLVEITQQLNSLKEKVTIWTLKREIVDGEDKNIISQTFTHKETYSEAFNKAALGTGAALLEGTQKFVNFFSKETKLPDPHDLRMKDLIVAQNEKEENFVPFQALNNYLLNSHSKDNIHPQISFYTLIEGLNAGEMTKGS